MGRQIIVEDTTAPTVTIEKPIIYMHASSDSYTVDTPTGTSNQQLAQVKLVDNIDTGRVLVSDSCENAVNAEVRCENGNVSCMVYDVQNDVELTNFDVSVEWDRVFNSKEIGDYVLTYTIKDSSDQVTKASRTFVVEDVHAPIMALVPYNDQTDYIELEVCNPDYLKYHPDFKDKGSNTCSDYGLVDKFSDTGASCKDYVDFDISLNVREGGDIVDLKQPGVYIVKYTCQDMSHNQASIQRTVTVVDNTNPQITLEGLPTVTIEA